MDRRGGEPGGEAGIEKLGIVGRVRFRIRERVVVYEEPSAVLSVDSASIDGGATGP